MIPIGTEKRVDWNKIRAEYIGGGTSYRKLCAKYGLSFTTLKDRARAERWLDLRTQADHEAATLSTQKAADAAADNATIAADIKKRLLLRLQRIEQKYPYDATEVRTHESKSTVIWRIRDLTAAYKDLTDGLCTGAIDKNAPIYDLIKRLDGECDV